MKITAISAGKRDKNRVNVSVDGKYRFSLDVYQLLDLGIKIGRDIDENEIATFEQESQFGKVYGRTLEYCLMRPHSMREVRDYLYRKTRPIRTRTGELRSGVSTDITARVFDRLCEKNYINDSIFARFWIENHSVLKGTSIRKLTAELRTKGISDTVISQALNDSGRSDNTELQKIISRKRKRYPNEQKLIAYLARIGFNYTDIMQALIEHK